MAADDRRRFSDEVYDAALEFETVSAYLLGRDVGALVNRKERAAVANFLAKVRDERDPIGTQARMANVAPIAGASSPRSCSDASTPSSAG